MRKIIPLMLAVVLLMGMSFHSAATQTTETQVAGTTNVKANYVPGEEGGQVISVDIAWEGMEFTYNGASNPLWDATNHQYKPGTDAGWAESNASISIKNHSNVILRAGIAYSQKTGYEDMDLQFTDVAPYVGSAQTSDGAGTACEVIIRTIPMGELPKETAEDSEVGEIRVTVTPVTNHTVVLDAIGTLSDIVPVKTDSTTLSRGELYFASADVQKQVTDLHGKATTAIAGTSEPAKNLALNALITAYYNNLYLMQE